MAPRNDAVAQCSLPGMKYPTYRDDALRSAILWLKGKQVDDSTDGLWRVHDDLYDVSSFIEQHPGGAEWLTLTKGTDITEAFEAHHINTKAEVLLKKFHVRKATTPRNSPYTFHENGFYKTLKRRAREILGNNYSGPSVRSIIIADSLLAATLLFSVQAAATGSYYLAMLAGVFLCYTGIAAHNFFHQKNNFRMFYFDLTLMSSRDWRISHAISHHLYPNTILDLEMSLFEPFFVWRPISKTFVQKYVSWIYAPVMYALVFFLEFSKRVRLLVHGHLKYPLKRDFIPLVIPACMYVFAGSTLINTVLMWLWIVVIGSLLFGLIAFNAGHHHPDTFHEGDIPRNDRDWGMQQLDAVHDRKWISSNLLLVLTNFGNHSLHHMFPTVDHDKLYGLKDVFQQTCREFGVDFQLAGVWECIKGQFLQMARVQPRTNGRKRYISRETTSPTGS